MTHANIPWRTLTAAIGMALAIPVALAQQTSHLPDTAEAPRIVQAISAQNLTALPGTHGTVPRDAGAPVALAASTPLAHLQVVLKPSAARQAKLQQLIADQHDPGSPRFHQWLTPEQYGQAFGVTPIDIGTVTAWLTAQGLTVNAVYPNQSQIDISGTVGRINQAFHTQALVYKVADRQGVAMASDLSVPSALQPVIAGIVGLNGAPAPASLESNAALRDPATGRFMQPASKVAAAAAQPMAIGSGGLLGLRGLVPDDLTHMYGTTSLYKQGITGKGVTIAIVELGSALPGDWSNFVATFGLAQYGGTFRQFNPQLGDLGNCYDVNTINGAQIESVNTAADAEYATAMAPGANIEVADCSSLKADFTPASSNIYQGFYIAATNLTNGDDRPDIMTLNISYSEDETDSASKIGMDLMAAQADAEGISIFASTGNTGPNPRFYGQVISGAGLSAGSLASSPNVTAVGGTDLADPFDGTTSTYFRKKENALYGTALGYVPEIPWNNSCGNEVAAKANGYGNVVDFCKLLLSLDPNLHYVTSVGSSSGASVVDRKPAWQRLVRNAAKDQSRDVPDVALYGGSYGNDAGLVLCIEELPCTPGLTSSVAILTSTSEAAPMFAGIQALIDQSLAEKGLPVKQGNAAPTLYALAEEAYGPATGKAPASLAGCNADSPDATCVFHNITRGSTSTQCWQVDGETNPVTGAPVLTPNCKFYGTGTFAGFSVQVGLTTLDPTQPYSKKTEAYPAQPGWSFASGLGSVNAGKLVKAWQRFVNVN
jgi:subtilase family serine protease